MKQTVARKFILAGCVLLLSCLAQAQNLTGSRLTEALQQGGLVLVMRHTSSPQQLPDAASVNQDNVNTERQLDDKGRRDAAAIGEALRRLQVPIGEVFSSPAYRALETAQVAGLDDVAVQAELGNENMGDASARNAAWLREQVRSRPPTGNRVLITHGPNLSAAFPAESAGMEEGEMLVFDPEGNAGPAVVARIKSGDWELL